MNAKIVGLKFMLEGSHFLTVAVTESDVKRLMTAVAGQSGTVSGVCLSSGASWMLKAERVLGVHSFDWVVAQQHAAQQHIAQQHIAQQHVGHKGMSGPH